MGSIKMAMLRIVAMFILIIWPILAFSAEVNLPKTGQTSCYHSYGNVIDCAGTGQDGDVQAGIDWPDPRFKDNGDGTVTDHLTGLVWMKDAGCAGEMSWYDAVALCNNLASDQFNLTDGSVVGDWRLPNIVELESLINLEVSSPSSWLNSQGFENVSTYYYWTGTTYSKLESRAWNIYMDFGNLDEQSKFHSFHVWPVRDGNSESFEHPAQTWKTGQSISYEAGDDGELEKGVTWPTQRFEDNGDGTVTDHLTGLVWLKNVGCPERMNWDQSLGFCNSLAMGSCELTDCSEPGDWRLPNRKELFSLIDYGQENPGPHMGHPFSGLQMAYFWTSSTCSYYSSYTWIVRTGFGCMERFNRSGDLSVWPVRDKFLVHYIV